MVATGYYVERAFLLTLSTILLVTCSYVTYTIYLRVRRSKNYLKLTMSCLGMIAAFFFLIENIDYETVFGIYSHYLIATFNHNAASALFSGAALLTIMHLEMVYKFMQTSSPRNIRMIGLGCGVGHWVAGNLCVLLMVVTKNEIFLGLYFVVYVVGVSALILFVNVAVCRVINTVKEHIRESNLTTAPELERVMRQSRAFQLGETIVCSVGLIILGMRAVKDLRSRPLVPGPSNPQYMNPDVYSFGGELVVALILGDFVANVWMFVGERQSANKGKSKSNSQHSKSSKSGAHGKSGKGASLKSPSKQNLNNNHTNPTASTASHTQTSRPVEHSSSPNSEGRQPSPHPSQRSAKGLKDSFRVSGEALELPSDEDGIADITKSKSNSHTQTQSHTQPHANTATTSRNNINHERNDVLTVVVVAD